MNMKATNFSVGSKGYCFLCLGKISPQFTPVKPGDTLDNSSPSVYSLQDISRYLKIDMRKVFIEEGPVPLHLLAKVAKSRLKVELCDGCGDLANKVSKHCRQLEKLKLEIESGLELIHGKMFKADESGMAQEFRRVVGSGLSSGMGGWMEILEALRMEAMQKCSRNINTSSPRLRIQKLTNEKIHNLTTRIPKREAGISSGLLQDTESQRNSIKTEDPAGGANWGSEDIDHGEDSFMGDLDDDADDSVSTSVKNGDEPILGPEEIGISTQQMETATTRNNLQGIWIINPETGKYKCQLCTMEFASYGAFSYHYSTVHRKLRFKCKICGKEFTAQGTLKRHHQNVHMGIRFQCQVCKKIFLRKDYLRTHQRKSECRILMN